MSKPPHRVLRIVLGFLSLVLAVAGVLLMILVHSDTLASQKRPSPPTHPAATTATVMRSGGRRTIGHEQNTPRIARHTP